MKTLQRTVTLFFIVLGCALFATGCDDLVADPNFHTWCGDQLCSWKLEAGRIAKAPTWHPKDYGVEFFDGGTTISQKISSTPKCINFSVIADVAPEAQVAVQVDFNSDGTIDFEQPIAAVGFKEQKTQISAPPVYVDFTLRITKKGTGRTVLAQLDAKNATDCTAAPVKLSGQAIGTHCGAGYTSDDSVCASGICSGGLCGECRLTGAAPEPVDAGGDADGDAAEDGGAPVQPSTCGDGRVCATASYYSLSIPMQCDPGQPIRPAGAECLMDDDCASHRCEGTRWDFVNVERGGSTAGCQPPPRLEPPCAVAAVAGGRCR